MPIERIDNAPATEVMAAVPGPVAAPTTPMPAQAPPPAATGTAPQRAIPPTPEVDPGGRPVATAAQVAALTQPAAYGKLAVVSSNFAGKEFDLTRPQMIIGRTDENDIVVPHRSISRNHAKVTRDPETQRYTIGDLQSSNGVRVNGQDYSKVELRRGDIIDLGHVRLRFIEPGEDFVFERDAVIADVEPPGAKRGLLVAAVLAVLVLGGVAAFLFVRSQHHSENGVTGDKGSASEVVSSGSGSNPVATTAPIDAAGSAAVAMVGSNPGSDTQAGSDTANTRKLAECHSLQADRKWSELQRCVEELKPLDPGDAKTLAAQASAEAAAEKTSTALEQALSDGNLPRARKLLDKIQPDSVYREKAQNDYEAAEDTTLTKEANDLAARHKCSEIDTLAGRAMSDALAKKLRDIPCQEPVAVVPIDCSSSLKDANDKHCLRQFCGSHPSDGHCPNTAAQTACNPDPYTADGKQKYENADYRGALSSYDQSLRCHYDPAVNRLAFIAACGGRDTSRARDYYRRMSSSDKKTLLQSCLHNGITEDQLKQ